MQLHFLHSHKTKTSVFLPELLDISISPPCLPGPTGSPPTKPWLPRYPAVSAVLLPRLPDVVAAPPWWTAWGGHRLSRLSYGNPHQLGGLEIPKAIVGLPTIMQDTLKLPLNTRYFLYGHTWTWWNMWEKTSNLGVRCGNSAGHRWISPHLSGEVLALSERLSLTISTGVIQNLKIWIWII